MEKNRELQAVVTQYLAERGVGSDEDIYAVVCEALDKQGPVRDYFQRQIDDGIDWLLLSNSELF